MRLAIVIALLVASRIASAEPTTDHPLDDQAFVIDAGDEALLEQDLRALRTAGVEMAVIVLQHTGTPIESYARTAAESWATGKSAAAVLVIAIGDRKSRLEVSDPLRTKFPDSRAQAILDNARGYLRNADYAGAVRAIINEVSAAHRGVAVDLESPHPQSGLPATSPSSGNTTPSPSTSYDTRYKQRSQFPSWVLVVVGLAIMLGIGGLWAAAARKSQFTLSHDGSVNTLQRPFVVDWLWHTIKIAGWVFFILFIIASALGSAKSSSSTWSSVSRSTDWGSSRSSSSGGSSWSSGGSSSSGGSGGGGWSGGGASSSW